VHALAARYTELPHEVLATLARRHGARTPRVLGSARTVEDLGEPFGARLYAREVDYFCEHEWAENAEDVLWRRTKAGLRLSPGQRARVAVYLEEQSTQRNR
jgi:glycerol-3-phosphate dehydrogenase